MTKDVELPPEAPGASAAMASAPGGGAPGASTQELGAQGLGTRGLGGLGTAREALRAATHSREAGFTGPFHAHPRGQLALCFGGLMRLEAGADIWFIPDRHGIWIPSGLPHQLASRSAVEVQNFFIHPRFVAVTGLPDHPVVVRATPLLRGIARRLDPGRGGALSAAARRRLGWTALDEMARLDRPDLHLPGGRDPRLEAAIEAMLADPGARTGLAGLAHRIGTSERTLSRLFVAQTGLSWRDWHSRLRFLLALEGLEMGESPSALASRLGYASPSAFIAAFRRQFGTPPGRWRREKL